MFEIHHLSSPFRTQGSDFDVQIVVPTILYRFMSRLGTVKRNGLAVCFSTARLDLWVLDAANPDPISIALRDNIVAMRAWDNKTKLAYLREKANIVRHNKAEKAHLAARYGLDARVYQD